MNKSPQYSIVPCFDNLNNKATEVNNPLVLMCAEKNIPFYFT